LHGFAAHIKLTGFQRGVGVELEVSAVSALVGNEQKGGVRALQFSKTIAIGSRGGERLPLGKRSPPPAGDG